MPFLDINPATVNVDLVYLGFVIGLWVAVTAAYLPGTGILEVFALLAMGASVVVLAQLPTNWFFLLVIAIGGSLFMLVPFVHQKYAPFALVGLAMQGLGGLLLFDGDYGVSPLVLAVSLIVPALYHQFILMPILRNMRDTPVHDRDAGLVGKTGRVTKALNPIGTVYVNSEHWTAQVEDDEVVVHIGEKVLVIGREDLRLIVEPLKRKRSPEATELESQ